MGSAQEQLNTGAVKGKFEKIPIIDLTPWQSHNIEERRKLAREVYEACTEVGFFYIKVIASPTS
jgi:isopenicillin N synthase-like dioxygenase